MISLQSVSFAFGDRVVLSDCSVEIEPGEIVALLGVNGAGKSTLMRLLAGLLGPQSGIVRVAGENPCMETMSPVRTLGFIPEGNPLYDHMTVGEYVRSMSRIEQPLRRDRTGREVSEAKVLQACDLTERVNDRISTLSHGWRQRVGLALALLGRSKALVLDEPFSGLDPKQADGLRKVVHDVSTHSAVMISTHLISDVEELYTRVLVLHEGSIAEDIPIEQWASRKQDVRALFESV